MKKIALILSALAFTVAAQAQISITGGTLTYTQDFNTLANSGTTNVIAIPGWSSFKVLGAATGTTNYNASDGSSNTGGVHSVGVASTTERALGSLGSGTASPLYYGAKFVNNTGVIVTSMHVTYKQEQWRAGDTVAANPDSVQFYYSLNALDVSDTGASATWTEVPALMMNSLSTVATSASGNALNGNSLFAIKNATVTLNVPAGSRLVIRWRDLNSLGSDDLNAVDSLTMVFSTNVAPPVSFRPAIVTLTPADNATNVGITGNLAIAFDRQVTKGATGNIYIKNVTNNTTVTKAVTSSDVTVAGIVFMIPLPGILPLAMSL